MGKTLLFVHGTGVREPAYSLTCALIENQLAQFAPHVRLARCPWGDQVGANLPSEAKSIPGYGETRFADEVPDDLTPALWTVLLQDPAFELRMLATQSAPAVGFSPSQADPAEELDERLKTLRYDDALGTHLQGLGLTPGAGDDGTSRTMADVFDTLIDSPGYKDCARSGYRGTPQHRTALARALVAAVQRATLEAGGPALDSPTRDALVGSIEAHLGMDFRGVGTWMMAPLTGLMLNLATSRLRRKRGALTDSTYPAAGDILLYQARGDNIRTFIRSHIDLLAGQQVVVLAHSLGGIACVELLAHEVPPNVVGLVTFGSQAPFLHEIGALRTLEPGTNLPNDFPPWSNFYDLNDPLSYVAEDVFPGRVTDYPVESGAAFPASHSAYLSSKPFWQQMKALLRDA